MTEACRTEASAGRDPATALHKSTEIKTGVGSTLVLVCGALTHEIVWPVETKDLRHVDVQGLPAQLHQTQEKIPEAVRKQIRARKQGYDKIYAAYGDCGTAGALDLVLEEEGGNERVSGPL
ncbi:MAG: DUF1638 domain-containing protein [Pseudomonadota bacterium]